MSNNYFFQGTLISGSESMAWIKSALSILDGKTSICSAYIKLAILKEIALNTNSSNIRFLARWYLNDLVGGASDIECYEFARDRGWNFYINTSLHAKIYHLPPSGILSGSANATSSGLGLSPQSNIEACTIIEANKQNISFIDNLFSNAVLINDSLYHDLVAAFNVADRSKSYIQWPLSVPQGKWRY